MPFSQSAIYRFAILFAALAFADFATYLHRPEFNVPVKYLYAAIVGMMIFWYALKWGRFDATNPAPALALFFTVVTAATFAFNMVIYNHQTSYVTAFIATLIFAAAMVIPTNAFVFDSERIVRHLLWLFSFGAVAYTLQLFIIAQTAGPALPAWQATQIAADPHEKSIVCALAVCLAILARRNVLAALLMLVTATALYIRPNTTLLLALSILIPLAVVLRIGLFALARIAVGGITVAAMGGPLLLYFFFNEISPIIVEIESYIKVDLLGGQTNTMFRLALVKHALLALDESLLFGKALDGEIFVLLAREFFWWRDISPDGIAIVHSDFVIILTQSGLVGYGLFATFLYYVFSKPFRRLVTLTRSDADKRTVFSASIVAAVALIIYCSFNPFLVHYYAAHLVWMLLLFGEMARKSLVAESEAVRVQWARGVRLTGAAQST